MTLLFDAYAHMLGVIGVVGLAVLGSDAVISALRGRRSLLERIGPLP
ncbi:MAG: hypothetical protein ACRECQ_00495 [Burkholderiaceae bacterium]